MNRVGPEEVNGFHGGYRESGLGGDDGAHGLDGYFRKQTV
jgi:lactaldehyde dehydrogenase/glycolaldehyde dehydrogenase